MVEKTIKETDTKFWHAHLSSGMIRLRKKFGSRSDWDIETFGTACNLADAL